MGHAGDHDLVVRPGRALCRSQARSRWKLFLFNQRSRSPAIQKGRATFSFAAAAHPSGVLSDFPPTQRFGLAVLAGCVIDILANLFVLPLLGGAQWKKK